MRMRCNLTELELAMLDRLQVCAPGSIDGADLTPMEKSAMRRLERKGLAEVKELAVTFSAHDSTPLPFSADRTMVTWLITKQAESQARAKAAGGALSRRLVTWRIKADATI